MNGSGDGEHTPRPKRERLHRKDAPVELTKEELAKFATNERQRKARLSRLGESEREKIDAERLKDVQLLAKRLKLEADDPRIQADEFSYASLLMVYENRLGRSDASSKKSAPLSKKPVLTPEKQRELQARRVRRRFNNFTEMNIPQIADFLGKFKNYAERLIPKDHRPTVVEATSVADAYAQNAHVDGRDDPMDREILKAGEPQDALRIRQLEQIEQGFDRADSIEEKVDAEFNGGLETLLTLLSCRHEEARARTALQWSGERGDAVVSHKAQDYKHATDLVLKLRESILRVDGSVGIPLKKALRNFIILDTFRGTDRVPHSRIFFGQQGINNATLSHVPRVIAPMSREILLGYMQRIVSMCDALDAGKMAEYEKLHRELEDDPHQLSLLQVYLLQLKSYERYVDAKISSIKDQLQNIQTEVAHKATNDDRRTRLLDSRRPLEEELAEWRTFRTSNADTIRELQQTFIERAASILTHEIEDFAKSMDEKRESARAFIEANGGREKAGLLELLGRADTTAAAEHLYPLYAFMITKEWDPSLTQRSILTYTPKDEKVRENMALFRNEALLSELRAQFSYHDTQSIWSDKAEDKPAKARIVDFYNKVREEVANTPEHPLVTMQMGQEALKHRSYMLEIRAREKDVLALEERMRDQKNGSSDSSVFESLYDVYETDTPRDPDTIIQSNQRESRTMHLEADIAALQGLLKDIESGKI